MPFRGSVSGGGAKDLVLGVTDSATGQYASLYYLVRPASSTEGVKPSFSFDARIFLSPSRFATHVRRRVQSILPVFDSVSRLPYRSSLLACWALRCILFRMRPWASGGCRIDCLCFEWRAQIRSGLDRWPTEACQELEKR